MSDRVWGPYRGSVDERLGSCEDFVGRLRRSIEGEIAPDRHYFSDKAHELRDAAQSLVDHVEDVEWWLGACEEQIVEPSDEHHGECLSECGRVAGHAGDHVPEERCLEERVLRQVRSFSAAYRLIADRLAWGLLTLRAGADVTTPEALAGELRKLQHDLGDVASSVERLSAPVTVRSSDGYG